MGGWVVGQGSSERGGRTPAWWGLWGWVVPVKISRRCAPRGHDVVGQGGWVVGRGAPQPGWVGGRTGRVPHVQGPPGQTQRAQALAGRLQHTTCCWVVVGEHLRRGDLVRD